MRETIKPISEKIRAVQLSVSNTLAGTPFEQYIVIVWHNGPMWVEQIVSENPITIDGVAAHYQAAHGFNEDRDSLEFVDPLGPSIKIDECDDATDTLVS